MAIVKSKPTSPGRRGLISVKSDLYKGKPHKSLIEPKSKNGGRNNNGRITVRHQGGGHKQHYRVIDFKRNKFDIPAIVERIEYDPNRSAHIALLKYLDGERRYIIAPSKLKIGDEIISSDNCEIKVGNSMKLKDIPLGTNVHCVELKPMKGAQIARSAGTSARLVAKDEAKILTKLFPKRIAPIRDSFLFNSSIAVLAFLCPLLLRPVKRLLVLAVKAVSDPEKKPERMRSKRIEKKSIIKWEI